LKNKIQILLFYYERPNFILNALKSIQNEKYDNFEVHFIDDGSIKNPGQEIVKEFFKNDTNILSKFIFYNTNDTKEQKLERGGSIFGYFANEAMKNTDSDISIMLCDDDALYPNYLQNLNNFYNKNKSINYAFSHVSIFDPFKEKFENFIDNFNTSLNLHIILINPVCRVDASQVSWRTKKALEHETLFPFPKTYDLDASLYEKMFQKFGPCNFTGFVGQYKAFHLDQLGNKRNTERMYEIVEK